MQNPFESGHIKNYLLLYVSVVVIMVLFFIATTLFNDVQEVEKRLFETKAEEFPHAKKHMQNVEEINGSRFKLMKSAY